MHLYRCLGLALLATIPAWSQLSVIPYETSTSPADEQMRIPPPVSGQAYPAITRSEERSNYLRAGLTLITARNSNVVVGANTTPESDTNYSILPTISLNQTTPRNNMTLTYSPGFTFYQHTSSLNAMDQNGALNWQYRISQHTNVTVNDDFQKSSNIFNQLYPIGGVVISGSGQSPSAEVVAPNANRLSNIANVGVNTQFSRDGMIGANGVFIKTRYSNAEEASDFSDSNLEGGSVFYSRRLSNAQYLGGTYQYVRSSTHPVSTQTASVNISTEVQTHTISTFYTVYLNPTLSLSFSIGPQYFDVTQTPSLSFRAWTPYAAVSLGWQRSRTNWVASYARTVIGDTGLVGAFYSNSAATSVRWLPARRWAIELSANLFIIKNVAPLLISSTPDGHTVSGAASLQHVLNESFVVEFRYAQLHQSYDGIATLAAVPNSSRVSISVSYHLRRPLGR